MTHWLSAARPRTLPAAIVPVVLASILAHEAGSLQVGTALLCLVFALLTQVATNFANDYYDFVRGADRADRIGPTRAVAAGLIPPKQMLLATWLTLAAAFGVGLLLLLTGPPWILPLGVLCLICAVAYTGGPWPIAYLGLGDLFAFAFFGPVAVLTTYHLQVGALSWSAFWVSAAVGALIANILAVNNYRDMEQDRRAGKRTTTVRFGRRFTLRQYALSLLFAQFVPILLCLAGHGLWVLLPLPLTLWALRLCVELYRAGPRSCNRLLAQTALYLLVYGLLLALGLLL